MPTVTEPLRSPLPVLGSVVKVNDPEPGLVAWLVTCRNALFEVAVHVQLDGTTVTAMLVAPPPALWVRVALDSVMVVQVVAAGVGAVGDDPPPHAEMIKGRRTSTRRRRM